MINIRSSTELRQAYNNCRAGHFFDSDTMRFFRSRLTSHFRVIDSSRDDEKFYAFITTESNYDGSKRYANVRLCRVSKYTDSEGYTCMKFDIDTFGEFNTLSLYQAKTVLKRVTKEDFPK